MPALIRLQQPESLLDGDLDFYPDAISAADADVLLRQLQQELPWASATIRVYGKEHVIPRLQCWLGDAGLAYTYSGQRMEPLPWHPRLHSMAQVLAGQLAVPFNSVLCNLYRDGTDGMGWHADNESELGTAPCIVSVSLGATRDFALRRVGESRQWGTLPLSHGSVLVMNAGMQSRWQHAVPKRAGIPSARINLTFRYLQPEPLA